jgi:hypothetical protein
MSCGCKLLVKIPFLQLIIKAKPSILTFAKVQANTVFFWPLDDIELVDWTSENKFARLGFCEDIHHSSILKLAIERAIQKSINANSSSKLFQDDSNKKISLLGLCLHTKRAHC